MALDKKFEDLEISIIGDVLYSRVARSTLLGFLKMGSKINILGPKELTPHVITEIYESLDKSYKNKIKLIKDKKYRRKMNNSVCMAPYQGNNCFDID